MSAIKYTVPGIILKVNLTSQIFSVKLKETGEVLYKFKTSLKPSSTNFIIFGETFPMHSVK